VDIKTSTTERTVVIDGPPKELEGLALEISTWTPSGGWSDNALDLFAALRGEEVESD
jgi:hypothetical protein